MELQKNMELQFTDQFQLFWHWPFLRAIGWGFSMFSSHQQEQTSRPEHLFSFRRHHWIQTLKRPSCMSIMFGKLTYSGNAKKNLKVLRNVLQLLFYKGNVSVLQFLFMRGNWELECTPFFWGMTKYLLRRGKDKRAVQPLGAPAKNERERYWHTWTAAAAVCPQQALVHVALGLLK